MLYDSICMKLCIRWNYSNKKHITDSQEQGDGVRGLKQKGPKETWRVMEIFHILIVVFTQVYLFVKLITVHLNG